MSMFALQLRSISDVKQVAHVNFEITMKIVKINHISGIRWGYLINDQEVGLLAADFALDQLATEREFVSAERIPLESVALLAPTVPAPKIICIGKNYADHAAEMGGEVPELPIVFSKYPNALNAPFGNVVLPAISNQVDYEAELVVVIGRSGKHIAREAAMDHILGYTCGNDISARDWQKGRPGGQWLVGKSFDTFAPVGPWITTADEISEPGNLDVELRLNGVTMQQANTNLLIYPIPDLVSYLSQFFTLDVGDLIFTGTPAGVGAGRNPPLFLKPNDEVEVSIEGLGSIKNRIVSEILD